MGKYLPVIVTAECGSLTRAAQTLGYTQPSLGYIISNLEEELGAKIFFRSQRGMTLTDVGAQMLQTMRKIEELEGDLQQQAQAGQGGLLRVGILPSMASQWLPAILAAFREEFPETAIKLEHQLCYLDGEMGVKEHKLDCAFFTGQCPPGLESFPLYEDHYYLVVGEDSELAGLTEVSVEEIAGKYPFIPTSESFDDGSAIWKIYQAMGKNSLFDGEPQENQMAVALVEHGLGVTILPGLTLHDLVHHRKVVTIPLKGSFRRTISLLCSKEGERTAVTSAFLRLTQREVAEWEQKHQTI